MKGKAKDRNNLYRVFVNIKGKRERQGNSRIGLRRREQSSRVEF